MTELSENPSLKEINAYKKKLTWGEIPNIYHMASSSLGEIENILTHGFDSAYKHILDRRTWNLSLLRGAKSARGEIEVQHKPKIYIRHDFNEMGYELHCFPSVGNAPLQKQLINHPQCPFIEWLPERHQMLFRITNFSAFIIYACQSGDPADKSLVRYGYFRVQELIENLAASFDIVDTDGFTIADFYQEVQKRQINSLEPGL